MAAACTRTLRYARSWLTGRDDVQVREIIVDRDGTPVPTTLLTPRDPAGELPAWIILHGITRPGRAHIQLVRFTRALAEGGCAVLVPEVPEWRELELAPSLTLPTILACLEGLRALGPVVSSSPPGLLGFSFGAPQALAVSGHPALRNRLAGVAGFGGYCDLERTVVFQFTGRHEHQGETHHLRPDPYGRWIVGANYLTSVPGMEEYHDVAAGLRQLAARAGDEGVMSWDQRFDAFKVDLRGRMPPREREVFDLFAPPSHREPDPSEGEELARKLTAAGRRVDPGIEPGPALASVPGPVHLLHGRQDHLIPFTEMYRIQAALPPGIDARGIVTRLFGHSSRDSFPGLVEGVREMAGFVRALSGILGVV
jgi:pimeloyl-ACP methyl ester carboxylesterase